MWEPTRSRETGDPQGLGNGSGPTPSLNTVTASTEPSPQSQANVTSSEPGSEIDAVRATPRSMNNSSRSGMSQSQVSGWSTLNVWRNVRVLPSPIPRISHAGFAPFGWPFTGSSVGEYSRRGPYVLLRSRATTPGGGLWFSGVPRIPANDRPDTSEPSLTGIRVT